MSIRHLLNFDYLKASTNLYANLPEGLKYTTEEGILINCLFYSNASVIRNAIVNRASPLVSQLRNWLVYQCAGTNSAHTCGISILNTSFAANANVPTGTVMVVGFRALLSSTVSSPQPYRWALSTATAGAFTANSSNAIADYVMPKDTDQYIEIVFTKTGTNNAKYELFVNGVLRHTQTGNYSIGFGSLANVLMVPSNTASFLAFNDICISVDLPGEASPVGRLGPVMVTDLPLTVTENNGWTPLIGSSNFETVINSQLEFSAGNYVMTDSVQSEPNGQSLKFSVPTLPTGDIAAYAVKCVGNTSLSYFGDLRTTIRGIDDSTHTDLTVKMPYSPAAISFNAVATAKAVGGVPLTKEYLEGLTVELGSVSRF